MSASAAVRRRVAVRIEGTVQGVGFRPFVYRLARELGIEGFVCNDDHGVVLEAEGEAEAVTALLQRLPAEAPPLAVIERVAADECRPVGERASAFEIRASERHAPGEADAPVTPDTATCDDCLGELLDPRNRRYRYPFTNCTNCGPRFTIVRGIPYDRSHTTMAGFRMCADCQAEYDDPADRRFHAQPNACSRCGPRLSLVNPRGEVIPLGGAVDPLAAAAAALVAGKIMAIKGIGGYHLACRADDEAAVTTLRARKHREDKPFALMVAGLAAVEGLVELDAAARELLLSPARPIVLAPRRSGAPVGHAVAPRARELGVMLPYSPLHHLLLHDIRLTLVMTSGNASDEPISFDDADARDRLGGIADLFLVHDRAIETRTDDSVVRILGDRERRVSFVRRSRGYVPGALSFPGGPAPRPLLAVGAELKNTFCVAKGQRAWVSHHIGDLENAETLASFTTGIDHFERLFSVTPETIAHDLHPEYLSTKYALERAGVEPVGVQHHHAHLGACLAEHGETGPAIGAVFDGSGYGLDGTIWGGEILFGDLCGFRRVGALRAVRLAGGEQAIRQPWRVACAWLTEIGGEDEPELPVALRDRVDATRWGQVSRLARTGFAAPQTTSVGRLFDAVAALCGLRAEINYEGQAAIELEAECDPHERGRYPLEVVPGGAGLMLELDPRELVSLILADVAGGTPAGVVASRFHNSLAVATVDALAHAAAGCGIDLVVLSGGVFLNRRLATDVRHRAAARGLRVLMPERLTPGDGGISYGQAAIAARTMEV
jgi:hydrogenase maturation protein HypF